MITKIFNNFKIKSLEKKFKKLDDLKKQENKILELEGKIKKVDDDE